MNNLSDNFGEKLTLTFSLKSCVKGFYYHISVNTEENFKTEKFETEKILCTKEGDNIIFKEKMIYDFHFETKQNLIITTHKNWDKNNGDDFERKTTLSSLVQSHMGKYERKISKHSHISEIICIQLDKDKSQKKEKILFDYLKLGLKFSFHFAFDFSKKDKNIRDDFTNISIDMLQKLIKVFGSYFQDDHFLKPLILGGYINKSNIYCINKALFSDEKGLIDEYKNFLENKEIVSKNNVNLSPFIKNLINEIYFAYKSNVYSILFIFLSGDISKKDQKETINKIIQSSYLPLSIIVIGIGNHDFSEMKDLFLDSINSTEGMPKNKDNVIFFSIKNKFVIDITLSGCLMELKKQIIDFFNLVKEPQEKGINIQESYNLFKSVVMEYSEKKEQEIINENKEISNSNNSNNLETENDLETQININNNPNNVSQSEEIKNGNLISFTTSLGPAPPSNVNSCNDNDNNNNIKSTKIEEENKLGKENKEKFYTNAGSAMDSTKVSNIKESTESFSIFKFKLDEEII